MKNIKSDINKCALNIFQLSYRAQYSIPTRKQNYFGLVKRT